MTAIEDAGMTDEEKVIYILRRSFHETPNAGAMAHIARTIIDSLKESPTDDEADRANQAFHEYVWGPSEKPLTRRELGITRQAWKAALEAARDA